MADRTSRRGVHAPGLAVPGVAVLGLAALAVAAPAIVLAMTVARAKATAQILRRQPGLTCDM
jgi:hypothetical protein